MTITVLTSVTEFSCNCGDSEHIQLSGEPCTIPARHYHLSDILTKSSNCHCIILTSPLFQDGGAHDQISEFHEHGPNGSLLHFLCSEVCSLSQSSAIRNIMVVHKTYLSLWVVVLVKAWSARKASPYPE